MVNDNHGAVLDEFIVRVDDLEPKVFDAGLEFKGVDLLADGAGLVLHSEIELGGTGLPGNDGGVDGAPPSLYGVPVFDHIGIEYDIVFAEGLAELMDVIEHDLVFPSNGVTKVDLFATVAPDDVL